MKTPWSNSKYEELEKKLSDALAHAKEEQHFADTTISYLRDALHSTEDQLERTKQLLTECEQDNEPGGLNYVEIEEHKAKETYWRLEAERAYKARDNAKAGFARLKKKIDRLEAAS